MQIWILTLSWEYPPYKIGGIAEHVYELSKALTRKGQEVHVVTLGTFPYEENEGVHLHRIAIDASKPDFITRMNEEMKKIGASIIESTGTIIDIIHAHDWMVGNAATALAFRYKKPLVTTIHSTEFGRSQGVKEEYQMRIHEAEKQLARLSDHVIVCSESMKREIQGLFGVTGKISVIPNGIDASKFDFEVDRDAIKEKFGGQRSSKLILFLGRLVYQKGVNVLIGALPIILSRYSNSRGGKDVKLVIVGEGPMRKQLERDATYLGVSKNVVFTGYLDDHKVRSLLKAADVVVVPSFYEPFGIVAIEAMAAKTPVVVSDIGGLSELISDGEGIKMPPNNSESLAACIVKILSEEGKEEDKGKVEVEEMVEKGFKRALALNWDKVSEATIGVYAKVLARAHASSRIPAQEKDIEIRIETGTEKGELWKYSYS
uniref:D-inositol-3-phosphate glycosyltransferase n=1 Tax=Candidatus Methanophagaceae archaeon ANME-1 ERB6 TaxID=2759912 RepID=A0A7G9YXS1_9EURY|nr:D-inositol-3-phosphate glycosyltransferase [Methanosarcinales archaeon ANME-1 ERB6]